MKSLLPIILAVAAVGLFFFQVKPLYNEVSVLRAQEQEYDEALEMAKELDTLRGDLSKKLDSFSGADLNRLDRFLPRKLDTVRIVLDIDGIGVRNGLNLSDISVSTQERTASAAVPERNAKLNAYEMVGVSFGFTAPYAQGVTFIKDLERSLRLLDSASVKVKPNAKSGYDFDMSLKTYWINR